MCPQEAHCSKSEAKTAISSPNDALIQPEGNVLSTLRADGRRRWLYPRLSKGIHWHRRLWMAWGLILFFTILPWLKINGLPPVQIDLLKAELTLMGSIFRPTDTLMLALFILTLGLTIFFVTALFGRVWCGWACPQTVYLEYVFRPIERLFTGRVGRGGKPKSDLPAWRKPVMYLVFALICVHLANTFLAYFVGIDNLNRWIWTSSPATHPGAFLVVLVVAGWMFFDLAYWREQMCLVGCPYGRFQSVMLDQHSLIVGYDERRGEPRGRTPRGKRKKRKAADASAPTASSGVNEIAPEPKSPSAKSKCGGGCESCRSKRQAPESQVVAMMTSSGDVNVLTLGDRDLVGQSLDAMVGKTDRDANARGDCIDCTMCVQVCPTGIDIRDGLQMECINCTQCIDACNDVMDRIGKPRGLIRYSAQAALAGEPHRLLRPRVVIYPLLILILSTILMGTVAFRPTSDVTLLRNPGRVFSTTAEGMIDNTWQLKIVNRTQETRQYTVSIAEPEWVSVEMTHDGIELEPGAVYTEPIHVLAHPSAFRAGRLPATVRVTDDRGDAFDRLCQLRGPSSSTSDPNTVSTPSNIEVQP